MIADKIKMRTIVGLEIHVQLATRTKLFCGCALEFGAPPNSRTCPVCLGLPGALPVMNRRAYELSVEMALAMNCRIATFTKWDRKSYYYPDLPKNYQISQYDLPLGYDGYFEIPSESETVRSIGIIRAHLEEDAGKNLHDTPGCSLVDLNRTGTPLLEIVTQPDIASAEEAFTFCVELQKLAVYLGISEASMEKGHMRFEPNINVEIQCDGETHYTPIAEVKNLNSFKAVRDAIAYEERRQVQDWLANPNYVKGQVPNENRGFNADRGITEFQRSKEAAQDYRYFPDPDLVPVTVTPAWIDDAAQRQPELPAKRRERLMNDCGLSESDADALVSHRKDADLFDEAIGGNSPPTNSTPANSAPANSAPANSTLAKRVANLMLGMGRKIANEQNKPLSEILPEAGAWRQLAELVEAGTINATAGEKLLGEVLRDPRDAVDFQALATSRNLIQVRDEGAMAAWVERAFAENESAVQDALQNPKKTKAATGFLTGQVMRISGGQADPKLVGQRIREQLDRMKG